MTNFYLSKWNGEISNLGISRSVSVDDRNPTVTEYGMGYERYAVIDDFIKNPPIGIQQSDIAKAAMRKVSYRQIYTAPSDEWTSEFLLRTSDPSASLRYRLDMLDMPSYLDFRARAKARCEAEDTDDEKGIRPEVGVTWQTVHSSTYDLENLSLEVYAQEDYAHKHVFSLN